MHHASASGVLRCFYIDPSRLALPFGGVLCYGSEMGFERNTSQRLWLTNKPSYRHPLQTMVVGGV